MWFLIQQGVFNFLSSMLSFLKVSMINSIFTSRSNSDDYFKLERLINQFRSIFWGDQFGNIFLGEYGKNESSNNVFNVIFFGMIFFCMIGMIIFMMRYRIFSMLSMSNSRINVGFLCTGIITFLMCFIFSISRVIVNYQGTYALKCTPAKFFGNIGYFVFLLLLRSSLGGYAIIIANIVYAFIPTIWYTYYSQQYITINVDKPSGMTNMLHGLISTYISQLITFTAEQNVINRMKTGVLSYSKYGNKISRIFFETLTVPFLSQTIIHVRNRKYKSIIIPMITIHHILIIPSLLLIFNAWSMLSIFTNSIESAYHSYVVHSTVLCIISNYLWSMVRIITTHYRIQQKNNTVMMINIFSIGFRIVTIFILSFILTPFYAFLLGDCFESLIKIIIFIRRSKFLFKKSVFTSFSIIRHISFLTGFISSSSFLLKSITNGYIRILFFLLMSGIGIFLQQYFLIF